jgi:hypothetical protein
MATHNNKMDTILEIDLDTEKTGALVIQRPSRIGYCVFFWQLFVVVIIYTIVNIELVRQQNVCKEDQIDRTVLALIIGNRDSVITYKFDDVICNIIIFGGSGIPVNSSAYIFRSNSGRCGINSEDNGCNDRLIHFNLLYTIFGVAFTLIFVYSLFMCFFDSKEIRKTHPCL